MFSPLTQSIDEDCVNDWVCSSRLPLFFKSELFYEYKLCHALNKQNEGTNNTTLTLEKAQINNAWHFFKHYRQLCSVCNVDVWVT